MIKNILITLSIISLSMHTYAMQKQPNEVLKYIITLSCPPVDLRYNEEPTNKKQDEGNQIYTTIKLNTLVTTIMNIRCVNKQFNNIIIKNINTSLNLNKNNCDAFLIRSTQANIPYFIKTAIAFGANPNFVHKPDGYTPLLYTTFDCCYPACKFLLEHGADVNLKMKEPSAYGYGYHLHRNWPIHVAVKNFNYKLVTLFINNKALLNVHINGDQSYSLLSVAANNNDPHTLLALFNNDPSKNWKLGQWKSNQIDHAHNIISSKLINNYHDATKQTTCMNLLLQAKVVT